MPQLTPAQRLIVAADYKPSNPALAPDDAVNDVADQVITLAHRLEGTGVCIKVNSALRAFGYELIEEIHSLGLTVFADLKLNDIPETMAADGALLALVKPDFVTVMASAGKKGIAALKQELPDAEILGVTVLTSLGDDEARELFGETVENAVLTFAKEARLGGADGIIASAQEARMLREVFSPAIWTGMTINTPAIRPAWFQVQSDDQKRSTTPADAIRAGADRIVVGRPIIRSDDPLGAAERTLAEIASAL